MRRLIASILTSAVSVVLIGCASQKHSVRSFTSSDRLIRITNNTQVLLDIRCSGKLVRSRLSPNDSFDLSRTWSTPNANALIATGYDASGRFVGTSTREFHFTKAQVGIDAAIVKSLENEGITAGRKSVTIEDLNPLAILRSLGHAAKALSPVQVSKHMQSATPMETWNITTLNGPGAR